MADPVKVDINDINHRLIQDVAEAIGASVGQYTTKQLGGIARMSRGPGGLGQSDVTQRAQEEAQRNIRGFSGGNVSSLIGGILRPPSTEEIFNRYKADSDRARLQMHGNALGIDPGRSGYSVDPGMFGGRMTAGQMMRMASDALANRAGGPTGTSFTSRDAQLLNASALLRKGASAAPYVSEAASGLQRAYRAGQGLTAYGSAMGYNPNSSNVTIPGTSISFQPPWNQAALGGLKSRIEEGIQSFGTAGLDMQQARDMSEQLTGAGYFRNNPRTGPLATAYAKAIGSNRLLNDPRSMAMADSSYRLQGANSMTSFFGSLQKLPSIATGAQLSLDRLLSGMTQFSKVAMAGGATQDEASKTYTTQTAATGIPADQLQGLDKNPIVKGQYVKAGVQPWNIATASAKKRITAQYGAIKQMYEMYGGKGVDPESARGRDIIDRILYNNPDLGLTEPEVVKMLKPGGQKEALDRASGLDLAAAYGSQATDPRNPFHNTNNPSGLSLTKMTSTQQHHVTTDVEKKMGLTTDERKALDSAIYKDGHLVDNWEKITQTASAAKAQGLKGDEFKQALKATTDPLGSADLKGLLEKAAALLQQAANNTPTQKGASNSGSGQGSQTGT
jgi:hypothetical protein